MDDQMDYAVFPSNASWNNVVTTATDLSILNKHGKATETAVANSGEVTARAKECKIPLEEPQGTLSLLGIDYRCGGSNKPRGASSLGSSLGTYSGGKLSITSSS